MAAASHSRAIYRSCLQSGQTHTAQVEPRYHAGAQDFHNSTLHQMCPGVSRPRAASFVLGSVTRPSTLVFPPALLVCGIPRCGPRHIRDKVGDQQSQFIERWNIHEQCNITANLFVADLELDVQKEDEVGLISCVIKEMQAAIARELAAQSEVPKSMPQRIADLVRELHRRLREASQTRDTDSGPPETGGKGAR
jgi:hypothetical protein